MSRRVLAVAILLFLDPHCCGAQTPVPPPRPPDSSQPHQDETPPYQDKLERLAELMGTLAFMADLCGVGEGPVWRTKMAELVSAEGKTTNRRDRLAGAFNRGFRDYGIAYRTCTPSAKLVIARSLAEGQKLARDLSGHFGS